MIDYLKKIFSTEALEVKTNESLETSSEDEPALQVKFESKEFACVLSSFKIQRLNDFFNTEFEGMSIDGMIEFDSDGDFTITAWSA